MQKPNSREKALQNNTVLKIFLDIFFSSKTAARHVKLKCPLSTILSCAQVHYQLKDMILGGKYEKGETIKREGM
jgi:hypothetical protein